MAGINIEAIKREIASFMHTPEMQKELRSCVNAATKRQALEAADMFISVLQKEIQSSGLSSNAIAAISGIEHTGVSKSGDGNYVVHIRFSGKSSRPSLDSATYGNINDIVMLFNNGVDHKMRPVHGIWHGQDTWSRTVIPGANFIESAIQNFMSNHSTKYHVINITLTDGLNGD